MKKTENTWAGNPDPLYAALGAVMTRLRKERAMTQTDVATALGLVYTAVTHYERAKNRVPLSVFVRWCGVLKVDPGLVLQMAAGRVNGNEES